VSGFPTVPAVSDAGPVFVPVAVAGTSPVLFCVDPCVEDPVAAWLQEHGRIDEPVQRAFLGLVRPGAHVLDLGCHLGTFSLPAAARGAQVLAVDAAPEHVRLLSLAAERNGYENLKVVQAAISDPPPAGSGQDLTVRFVVRSIHGHLQTDDPESDGIEVRARTVDDLLDERGWDRLDVVKMDIEGCEVQALRGMSRLFARGCRPAMVLESNAAMLDLFGSSILELRAILTELDYEVLLIDHLRPGVLVEIGPDTIQTESASDVLALPGRPPHLRERWRIEPPPSREHTVCRLLDAAASPAAGYRQVAGGVLRSGPVWLRETPAVRAAVAALDCDVEPGVRNRPPMLSALDYADLGEPASAGRPEDVVVWAESLNVDRRRPELERPFELAPRVEEAVLRGLMFHVGAAEPLAVLVGDPGHGQLLLEAVAGNAAILGGTISVGGQAALMTPVGRGLEPELTVRQNAAVFGGFLGAHVATVEARTDEILAAVGLGGQAEEPLVRVGADGAVRLSVAVALMCVRPKVLLIGPLPALADPDFAAWGRSWTRQLRAEGTAVVQVVRDPSELMIEPTRALWVDSGAIRAGGHAPSVVEAYRLSLVGFSAPWEDCSAGAR
jgi:FkbM family methyltransferase